MHPKFVGVDAEHLAELLLRLHHNDIIQGSFYVRNVMAQPGPLARAPAERSMATPSFRIIDFGRGRVWDWDYEEHGGESDADARRQRRREFAVARGDEVERGRRQLLVDDMGF